MTVEDLIKQLEDYANESPHHGAIGDAAQQIADELVALESIFGKESLTLLATSQQTIPEEISPAFTDNKMVSKKASWDPQSIIRICINIPLSSESIEISNEKDAIPIIKLSASLPIGYPNSQSAPQLQLLNRYIGSHGVDHSIFGEITRLYYHQQGSDNVTFTPGQVALFDGIEKAREKIESWYCEQEAGMLNRRRGENDPAHRDATAPDDFFNKSTAVKDDEDMSLSTDDPMEKIVITTSMPITERKSIFVGHAAVLDEPSHVPLILSQILTDKKVSRATHPTIYAWVCKSKGSNTTHRDCNDDGETAAGGRLAHLLDLLHLENIIVVVTRWYGGVQLGADRFKLINRAAREALEMANLVPGPLNSHTATSLTDTKSNKK